jgi:hypothetical protein
MTLIEKITNKVQDLPLEASPSEKDIYNYYLSINNLIKITEDFAIGFLDWYGGLRLDEVDNKTTEELLVIYKKEKGL